VRVLFVSHSGAGGFSREESDDTEMNADELVAGLLALSAEERKRPVCFDDGGAQYEVNYVELKNLRISFAPKDSFVEKRRRTRKIEDLPIILLG
jgi:hypothetical protein